MAKGSGFERAMSSTVYKGLGFERAMSIAVLYVWDSRFSGCRVVRVPCIGLQVLLRHGVSSQGLRVYGFGFRV